MSKYIFIDCDFTLTNGGDNVPSSAIKAIKLARDNGHKVILNTGRFPDEITEYIKNIGFDGYILADGALVYYDNVLLAEDAFSLEEEKKVVKELVENNIEVRVETEDQIYQSYKAALQFCDYMDEDINCCEYLNIEDYISSGIEKAKSIYACINTKEDLDFIYNNYSNYSLTQISNNKEFFILIRPTETNKGTGILKLIDHLKADINDTISIGDDYPDISMFKITPISICMDEASEIVKSYATYITDGIEEDGIYNAFVHFSLI